MDQPVRFPWDDFPDVLIHAPELFVKRHPSYPQAKAGDADASARVVLDSLSDDTTNRLSREFGADSPVLGVGSGLNYVLIDDFIGQGGTLANLRGHVS